MIHLTVTGYYAGQTFCGSPRNEQDTYRHLPYSTQATDALLADPDLCPECKKVYEECEEEE